MKIVIIDGQGGSIGASLVSKIKDKDMDCTIYGIGTNYFASKAMKKAGADIIATGENASIVNSKDADYILGTTGIVIADSLHGEISEKMAVAIGRSSAYRILIPFDCCKTHIVATEKSTIEDLLDVAVNNLTYSIAQKKGL